MVSVEGDDGEVDGDVDDDGEVDPACFSAACFWSSGANATYAIGR